MTVDLTATMWFSIVSLVLMSALCAWITEKFRVWSDCNGDPLNSYSADGTITAADTYTVKPMVKGTVLTADFEVGDTVNKGDVRHLRFELPRDDAGRR